MARTRGGSVSSGHKASHPQSLWSKLGRKTRVALSTQAVASSTSIALTDNSTVDGSSLPFSIIPSIFGFFKSLDLGIVGMKREELPSVNPITGWELIVYDPSVARSKLDETQSGSVEDSVGVHVVEDPVLETDLVVVEDIDEDEPPLQFKRKPTTQPGIKRQRKSTTTPIVPLNTSLYRRQTRSSDLAPILPLSTDTIDSPATKNKPALKIPSKTHPKIPTKTTTRTSTRPVPSQKPAQKRPALEQRIEQVESDEQKGRKLGKT